MKNFQQFLSIPVYTIFKNLTIILIVRIDAFLYFFKLMNCIGIWRSHLVRRTSYKPDSSLFCDNGALDLEFFYYH